MGEVKGCAERPRGWPVGARAVVENDDPYLMMMEPPSSGGTHTSGQSAYEQPIEPSGQVYVAPGPSHTPHSSMVAYPPQVPVQSVEMVHSPSQL